MAESSQPDPALPPQSPAGTGHTPPAPASGGEEEEPGGRMSFFEHLVELRKRIITSIAAIGIGMLIGFLISDKTINFIVNPILTALRKQHLEDRLYYASPATPISFYISLSLYIGIVIAMPVVLYQVWLFVAPGLYKHERRAVLGFVISSMFLFLCGLAFGYYVMLPQVLNFLINFGERLPLRPLVTIDEYFSFVLVVLVGLGVIFELPVLIFILSLFGIVTPKFLLKNFRYAMLIITIVAAIVTPTPDATTMLIFMAPMIALYFVGVLVSYMVLRNKRAKALAAGEAN